MAKENNGPVSNGGGCLYRRDWIYPLVKMPIANPAQFAWMPRNAAALMTGNYGAGVHAAIGNKGGHSQMVTSARGISWGTGWATRRLIPRLALELWRMRRRKREMGQTSQPSRRLNRMTTLRLSRRPMRRHPKLRPSRNLRRRRRIMARDE